MEDEDFMMMQIEMDEDILWSDNYIPYQPKRIIDEDDIDIPF